MGLAGPRGEPGPPGQLPSLDQVMPWLHLLFDAWEDYKRLRERETAERAALEAAEYADGPSGDDEEEHRKDKKKKHRHKK